MVKIYEDSQLTGNGALKPNNKSLTLDASKSNAENGQEETSSKQNHVDNHGGVESTAGALPEADLNLVEEVRALLRAEFEQNESSETIYSKQHYDDLMDPNSPNCCWRYLLQCDQNVGASFELVKQALAWRKENRIEALKAQDMIKDFWMRSPIGFTGKSRDGNDVVYAMGRHFRKLDPIVKQSVREFISFVLFDWDRKHRHDLAQLELVFDVSDTGLRNIDLDFSYWMVSIRDYVPARIKTIYFVGVPFMIRPVIRLVISWLPERFRRIVRCGGYDELVRANIDDEYIPEEIGGKSDNKWRLAPIESKWAHEHENPDAREIFEKICKSCSFNTSQERLDKLYRMQKDYEKSFKLGVN